MSILVFYRLKMLNKLDLSSDKNMRISGNARSGAAVNLNQGREGKRAEESSLCGRETGRGLDQ